MQVLPDAVIINISPSQRRIFRDRKYEAVFAGVILAEHGSNRPRIPMREIAGFVDRLRRLKTEIANDPDYQGRDVRSIIDQIILKVEDAAAAQRRTYPIPAQSN